MNDNPTPDPAQNPTEDHDPVLDGAGARLREEVQPLTPAEVEAAVLKRRSRRLGAVSLVSLVVVAVLAATVVAQRGGDKGGGDGAGVDGRASAAEVDQLLAGLGDAPVDPTKVRLVSTVTTFADCDALVADLRRSAPNMSEAAASGLAWAGGRCSTPWVWQSGAPPTASLWRPWPARTRSWPTPGRAMSPRWEPTSRWRGWTNWTR